MATGLLKIINPLEEKERLEQRDRKRLAKSKAHKPARKGKIDLVQLHLLAETMLPIDSIAVILGVSTASFTTEHAYIIEKAREKRKATLAQKMWTAAMNGSERMQIWLSKQHLGYREAWPDQTMPIQIQVNVRDTFA